MLTVRNLQGTTEAVKSSYETAWERTRTRLEREVATGDAVPTILARMNRLQLGDHYSDVWRKLGASDAIGRQVMEAYGVDHGRQPTPYIPVVMDGRLAVRTAFSPLRYIAGLVTPETTILVEFGSGWSANVFQLHLLLGNQRSQTLRYVGAEYTEAGRECGELLAKHDGAINYSAVSFDWIQPDLSWLDQIPGSKHVVAFSHHSIEQVEQISPDFYSELAERTDTCKLVHFEPVGWQRDTELAEHRAQADAAYFDNVARQLGIYPNKVRVPRVNGLDISSAEAQIKAAAWWSYSRRYNTNLLPLIDELTPRRMVLRDALFDYDSLKNPLNPSTMICVEVKARAWTPSMARAGGRTPAR